MAYSSAVHSYAGWMLTNVFAVMKLPSLQCLVYLHRLWVSASMSKATITSWQIWWAKLYSFITLFSLSACPPFIFCFISYFLHIPLHSTGLSLALFLSLSLSSCLGLAVSCLPSFLFFLNPRFSLSKIRQFERLIRIPVSGGDSVLMMLGAAEHALSLCSLAVHGIGSQRRAGYECLWNFSYRSAALPTMF